LENSTADYLKTPIIGNFSIIGNANKIIVILHDKNPIIRNFAIIWIFAIIGNFEIIEMHYLFLQNKLFY
jgi:hypothetical protein